MASIQSVKVFGVKSDGTNAPASFEAAAVGYVGDEITADVASAYIPTAGLRLMGYAAAETVGGTAAFEIRHKDMTDVVTNGAFDTDVSWTKGTGWTIDAANSNKAESDGSQTAASLLSQTPTLGLALVEGVSYTLVFTTTRSAGTITASVGGTAGTTRSTANTFTEVIVAGATGVLSFSADADFIGSVDTVTCIPVSDLVVPVQLAIGGIASAWFGPEGISVPYGLTINDLSGTYDITLFTKVVPGY